MSPNVPSRIDRAAFDRVLKRAAELQAGGHDVGDAGMSEEEVLALGQEVGIPAEQLKQALLEERVRVTPIAEPGILDRVIAPAEFQSERVVQGSVDAVTAEVTRWLEYHEHVVPQRASGGKLTFEPMPAFAGAMRKVGAIFDPSKGKPYLEGADLITAVVTPLEDGFCHVALAVTLRRRRSAYVAGGVAIASIGVAMGVIFAAVGAQPLVPLLPVIPGVVGGAMTARLFAPVASRGKIGLERALDALEKSPALLGQSKPGTSQSATLGRGVGEAVKEFTREVRKALDK